MEAVFRFEFADEPRGEIQLSRLEGFARLLRRATLRSAQAELSIPAYRKQLGEEPRPEYRLARLSDGSTTIALASVEDRPIDRVAVTRHLDALRAHQDTGSWPPGIDAGELDAWAAFYTAAFARDATASVDVAVDGTQVRVDAATVRIFREAQPEKRYRRIACTGLLHMIEVEPDHNPRFRINAESMDLVFELTPGLRDVVDPLRWNRVRAEALWEVGSNRASLAGEIRLSADPPGVEILDPEAPRAPWLSEQTQRLASFANAQPGWDGPGSRRIHGSVIEAAQELLRRLEAQFATIPGIAPGPFTFPDRDGGIDIEWQIESRFLLLQVNRSGYSIFATDADVELIDGPVTQSQLFQWLSWLLQGGNHPS
jgi:hypothetical protein